MKRKRRGKPKPEEDQRIVEPSRASVGYKSRKRKGVDHTPGTLKGAKKEHALMSLAQELGEPEPDIDYEDWKIRDRKLTLREMKFVQEYIELNSAPDAAERVGWVRTYGPIVLNKPHIKREIDIILDRRFNRQETTVDKLIEELSRIAFSNAQDFYNNRGNLRDLSDLPKELSAAIRKIKTTTFTNRKTGDVETKQEFMLYDKLKAIDAMACLLGMKKTQISIDQKLDSEHNINLSLEGLGVDELKLLSKITSGKRYLDAREVIDCKPLSLEE